MGLLDAAHLRAYRDRGSDDPRKGLVLCATHHRAFDKKLFGINPATFQLTYRSDGPGASELGIAKSAITHLPSKPHSESLGWCWSKFSAG
jgi:hypothetical protein